VGLGLLARDPAVTRSDPTFPLRVAQLGPLEALLISVNQNWPVILVGPPGSGKTAMINQLASFVGADLVIFSMNADIDAMDLVGGYEQLDPSRGIQRFRARLGEFVRRRLITSETPSTTHMQLMALIETEANLLTEHLRTLLSSMVKEEQDPTLATELLEEFARNLQEPQEIEGARFQWVDGVLIQALEQGKWLVLDNANLCSSAVLDRLNSLLEPNGYLSINEHSTADGEAQIVRPHPNFRIFLTMDPRFGELSRAMRNRAIEICLLQTEDITAVQKVPVLPAYPLESKMYRFRHFDINQESLPDTLSVRFEHLSFVDDILMKSFSSKLQKDHVPFAVALLQDRALKSDTPSQMVPAMSGEIIAQSTHLSRFLSQKWSPRTLHFQSQRSLATMPVGKVLSAMLVS
jgi:midasin